MTRYLPLAAFLLLVVGGGLAIGAATAPGDWYAGLAKPSFNPPGWVFGPVWTLLYILIAVAGWRVWQRERPRGRAHLFRSPAMRLWAAQLVLNFLWSPVFFTAHRIDLALVIVLMLLLTVLGFIAVARTTDRLAAWLFVPYAAWVAFAAVLNGAILRLN